MFLKYATPRIRQFRYKFEKLTPYFRTYERLEEAQVCSSKHSSEDQDWLIEFGRKYYIIHIQIRCQFLKSDAGIVIEVELDHKDHRDSNIQAKFYHWTPIYVWYTIVNQ